MELKKRMELIADFGQLMKTRLSVVVVFSAAMAYLWACDRHVDAATIWLLSVGGFLVTGASNALNQVLERDADALMRRTARRPLPAGRMRARSALALALACSAAGVALLFQINFLCGLLGIAALLVYTLVYTPMKKISAFAVVPGALAGSIPVLIGVAAATAWLTPAALTLFIFQFIWQFPHTWSIAWLQNDDYNKAGFKMLPSSEKGDLPALLILVSTFLILPACLLMRMYELAGIHVTWILAMAGSGLLMLAFAHYRKQSQRSALALMLSCLAFLPLALIVLVIEKFL